MELDQGILRGYYVPEIQTLGWIKIHDVGVDYEDFITDSKLHRGEIEVLILMRRLPNRVAIIDDRIARFYADLLGMDCTGVLGILIKAKKSGLVEDLQSTLLRLKDNGFMMSNQLFEKTLAMAECPDL